MTNSKRLIVAGILTVIVCAITLACTQKQAADVDRAADEFCSLHVKNKEIEAHFGLSPSGTHAKVEAGADAFCALREEAKRAESSPEAAGSPG